MRFVLTAAAILPSVLAWNTKLCNGIGGCSSNTWNPDGPFRCQDGTRLNLPQTAGNINDADNGDYTVITRAEYPSACVQGFKPDSGDTFVVRTTEFGQKVYISIRQTCDTANPVKGDCYNANPNPARSTVCQVVDTKGQNCAQNLEAGECERWGESGGRTQCKGWTPAQVEVPSTD